MSQRIPARIELRSGSPKKKLANFIRLPPIPSEMLRRYFIVAAFVCLAITEGANLFAAESSILWGSRLRVAQTRDTANPSRQAAKSSRKEEALGDRLDSLLGDNKEFFVYGAIAGFGILMMGLAIGSASSSRGKTDAQLELLKQEKEKAENLAKLKSEFLNQVSHELRTPLAVIIGYIECITDGLYGEIETKHQEILQIVAKQSSHLKNMIDQILIFSRLDANKQPVRIEEFAVHRILDDLRDTFDFLCRQKGLELSWEISKEVDRLKTDPERFKEIVSNLLQNAIKYTDTGS